MKPLSNFTLLFVVLFGCLTTCFAIDNNDINKSTKEGLVPIPDPMTKEFIMEMWNAPHDASDIIPEMESVRYMGGRWKTERKKGPNKDELTKDQMEESFITKFVKRRFQVYKIRRENWVRHESLEDSLVKGEDLIMYAIETYDADQKLYRRWVLYPDGFIIELSGEINKSKEKGDHLILENLNSPENSPDNFKVKISRKLDEKNGKELFSEVEFFSNEKLDFYSLLTGKWLSGLPKKGGLEEKISGKTILIEVVEGAQKDRMTFHFGEDDIIRVYDSEKLVDESMSYRVDGLEVKFLAKDQEDDQALDSLAMRMLFSSNDPKSGDEIIMKDRNNSFAGKIIKIGDIENFQKEGFLATGVSYDKLKETFDGKYLYKGKPYNGKVYSLHGGNRLWFEGNVINGKWEGVWTEWDKKGNKIQEDLYKSGELVSSKKINEVLEKEAVKEAIKDKLTDDQISEYLDFWIGKWDGFDKSTNQIIDSIELKWKEEGKSLESKGIIFEGGEQKDKFKGSISYDKKLGVFVDVQTFEASGETFIRHSILNLETQSEHGFPIKPEPPEDIDIKFTYKKVNQNNVDYTFEVLREGETLEKRESIIKRQGVEPKEGDPKADLPKLTAEQIVDHLEFWIGKWEGYDKSSNEIYDKFESKWKEKGKSLAFAGIGFEDGEQKEKYKGTVHYNKDLNVFVDTLTFENSGVTVRRHSVLDPESGISNGFPVLPKPPEDIEVKFKWKKVNRNNVDFTFKVLEGDEILEHKEFIVKRQVDEPKADPEIIKQREELTTNLITSMGEFADALAGIEDKKSALEAAAKFGGIAEKLEALAMKMEVLGFPEGSQAEEINSQMTKFEKEMQQKMNKSISPILVNEELNEVLMPALMKFGERMDKLTPVMEKWAGKKRASDPPKEEIALEAPKVEDVNSETLITLSVDGKEVTAERNIEGFPEFDFFYITSSGAFSVDEIRIGKTYDSVTQKSISDDEENILFHDSFEYATGEKLINQESWYSEGLPRHISNSSDTYTISEGSLVNDKIKSIGNRVSAEATAEISGIGIDLPDTVSFAPGDNVYISFLIRPEGVIGEGVWGGYFSFGAKPFVGKGILFGKPGDSSAPDDKKFAIDKQGGPIIRTSGVEVEVGKTSHVVVRLESKILDEPTGDESEENNALKKNIVGKLIGFEPNEGRLQFNDDGVMMFGLGADPKDVGLTYKVKGNEVLVFQRGKRDGGILFPSLNPKVGDEIEFGPDANKRNVTITKIESANKAGGEPKSLQAEKKLKLAIITNATADFWSYGKAGARKAASEYDDIEIEFKMGDGTAEKQREICDSLIARGFKGMVISPPNPRGQKQMINEWAKRAKIITIDEDAPDTERLFYFGSDNIAAGRQAGELLKEALPDGGKVMVFVGIENQTNAQQRYQGLKEAVQGTKIKIIGLRSDHADLSKARRNAENALTENPDLAGMVGLWAYNAPACLKAVKDKGLTGKVKIVAFDEMVETLKAIDAGEIYGTVVQQPYEFCYQAIKALRSMIIDGKSPQDLGVPNSKKKYINTKMIRMGEAEAYLKKIQQWKMHSLKEINSVQNEDKIKAVERTRIKEEIKAIEIGLLNYKISTNGYPTTAQGLKALITKPEGVQRWNGPYFDDIIDSWANEYGYRFPSEKGQNGPDIFSKGPDGLENTEDDIGNWEFEEDYAKDRFGKRGLEEMLRLEGESEKLLRSKIVGKAFSLKSPDVDRIGKLIFGEDGKMSINADGATIPLGSYAVDGLIVKVFEAGRQNGGFEFYSLNPRVGDQVSMIDETNLKLSIVEIESANNLVTDPKNQKIFEIQAKKSEAKNEIFNLINAINVYQLEYGKLPFKNSEKIQAKDLAVNTLSGSLLSVLSGHDTDGLNPRKLAFYQGKEAKAVDSKKPEGGVFGTVDRLQLADPWGNPYFIVFDSNYDGILKGLPGSGGKNVARNVVIWSTGGSEDFEKFDPDKWIRSWSK